MAKDTNTIRRRARRNRARARFRWHQHRTGVRVLSQKQLLTLHRILAAHHSRDPVLLKAIKVQVNKSDMASRNSFPWKCPCGRLNGKKADYCPKCTRHWSSGTPHSNEPKHGTSQSHATNQNTQWSYAAWVAEDSWQQSPRRRQSPRQSSNRTGSNRSNRSN